MTHGAQSVSSDKRQGTRHGYHLRPIDEAEESQLKFKQEIRFQGLKRVMVRPEHLKVLHAAISHCNVFATLKS